MVFTLGHTTRFLAIYAVLARLIHKEACPCQDAAVVSLVVVPPLALRVGLAHVKAITGCGHILDILVHYTLAATFKVTPADMDLLGTGNQSSKK